MKCFWLKDPIRDKNSLLLIAQCNFWFKRKKKSRVFRICTTAAGEGLELRGCTHYSLDIWLCSAVRQTLDGVCFYLWTCLHDKKTNIRFFQGRQRWTALKLIAGLWTPSSFSPAVCMQTSSFWNMGKWCTKMASCSSAVTKLYKGSVGPNRLSWHQEDGSLDHTPVWRSGLRVFRSFHRLHLCVPALVIVGLWMAALNTIFVTLTLYSVGWHRGTDRLKGWLKSVVKFYTVFL